MVKQASLSQQSQRSQEVKSDVNMEIELGSKPN